MAAPATFLRRYAAYSVDVAIVLVIAVPLVAWQLGDVPAAFDMAVASLQQRLFELFDSALYDGALYDAGPFELARRWADDPGLRAGLAALADVVHDAPGTPLPAWATAWLFLQVAAFFGLTGFVLLRYAQLLNEAVGASG